MCSPTFALRCRTGSIRRLLQETLQTRQREEVFDMSVVESKHQFRGKRPHPVVHDDRIMVLHFQIVINVVKCVIKINPRLCRKLRGQTHITALAESVQHLFEPLRRYGACRRLIYRTAGYIRDRNSRPSGIGRSGRLRQDRKSFGGLFECEGYALSSVFLHGVLIRFHVIDC